MQVTQYLQPVLRIRHGIIPATATKYEPLLKGNARVSSSTEIESYLRCLSIHRFAWRKPHSRMSITIGTAIVLAREISATIEASERKEALAEVERKIHIVATVLDLVQQSIDRSLSSSLKDDILQSIVESLRQLQVEVQRVRDMRKLIYIQHAKSHQEKLGSLASSVLYYLNSLQAALQVALTDELHEIIKKLLPQNLPNVETDEAGRLQLLLDQTTELRRLLDGKDIPLEQLNEMGLITKRDLQDSLHQAMGLYEALQLQRNAKRALEAADTEQFVEEKRRRLCKVAVCLSLLLAVGVVVVVVFLHLRRGKVFDRLYLRHYTRDLFALHTPYAIAADFIRLNQQENYLPDNSISFVSGSTKLSQQSNRRSDFTKSDDHANSSTDLDLY